MARSEAAAASARSGAAGVAPVRRAVSRRRGRRRARPALGGALTGVPGIRWRWRSRSPRAGRAAAAAVAACGGRPSTDAGVVRAGGPLPLTAAALADSASDIDDALRRATELVDAAPADRPRSWRVVRAAALGDPMRGRARSPSCR